MKNSPTGTIFVNGTILTHVVDRWVFVARSPKFYAVFFAFVIIGAIFGPFGVSEAPTLLERFQLSFLLNVISWSIGIFIVVPSRMLMYSRGLSHPKSIIISSTIANFVILPSFLWTLEAWGGRTVDLAQIFEQFLALAALITVIPLFMAPRPDLIVQKGATAQYDTDVEDLPISIGNKSTQEIVKKIRSTKRGVLWALFAQDHYVEFITEHGSELILMRFGDAVSQFCDGNGVQCHRSVWISQHVSFTVHRKNRRLVVQLPNGRDLPVARSREGQLLTYYDEKVAN